MSLRNVLIFAFGTASVALAVRPATAQIMMQGFYWDTPTGGAWYDSVRVRIPELKAAGISTMWLPPPAKGAGGGFSMGYDPFDHYDVGEYNQKGTVETRFGSRAELQALLTRMHSTSGGEARMDALADAVLNHMSGGNGEYNPVVETFVATFGGPPNYRNYPLGSRYHVLNNTTAGTTYDLLIDARRDGQSYTGYTLQLYYPGMTTFSTVAESEPANNTRGAVVLPTTVQTVTSNTYRNTNLPSDRDYDWVTFTVPVDGYVEIKLFGGDDLDIRPTLYKSGSGTPEPIQLYTYTAFDYAAHGHGDPQFSKNYRHFRPGDSGDNIDPPYNNQQFGQDISYYTDSRYMAEGLDNWGNWLTDQIGFDGFRLDLVKGITNDYTKEWFYRNNVPKPISGPDVYRPAQPLRFAVGEYFDGNLSFVQSWIDGNDRRASAFDFPLYYKLKDMANNTSGGFDMNQLAGANSSLSRQDPTKAVTFADNHDTDRDGGPSGITSDKLMAYAYILTQEGFPCVFWRDYYTFKLRYPINRLMAIHEALAGGTTTVLYQDADLLILQRNGDGTRPGLVLVLNDNASTVRGAFVNTKFTNTTLRDMTGQYANQTTDGSGGANLYAPARGYTVYGPEFSAVGASGVAEGFLRAGQTLDLFDGTTGNPQLLSTLGVADAGGFYGLRLERTATQPTGTTANVALPLDFRFLADGTSTGALNATVTYIYPQSTYDAYVAAGGTAPESALRVYRRNPATGLYQLAGTSQSADPALNRITVSGQNAFGEFAIAPDGLTDTALPVEGVRFTATPSSGGVRLSWTTQAEHDNAGFELVRLTKRGGAEQTIATMATAPELRGGGTTSSPSHYAFTDRATAAATAYVYRLRSVDLGGVRHDVATVEATTADVAAPLSWQLSEAQPNPFNPSTELLYQVGTAGPVRLVVFDALGREVAMLVNRPQAAGAYRVRFDGAALPSGLYVARLTGPGFVQTRTMSLVK